MAWTEGEKSSTSQSLLEKIPGASPRKTPTVPSYKLLGDGQVELQDASFQRVKDTDFVIGGAKLEQFKKNHAIHDSLSGTGKVEQYDLYVNREAEELVAVIRFGKAVNGYPGIVHGGILSLMIDDAYGMLFLHCKRPMSATANLNINFRSKVVSGSTVVLHCRIDKVDGRKLFLSGSVHDARSGKLCVDSTSLFVAWRRFFDLPWWAEPVKPFLGYLVKILP